MEKSKSWRWGEERRDIKEEQDKEESLTSPGLGAAV